MIQNKPESVAVAHTDFHFKNQISKYTGKVRDVYELEHELIIIATDRISAFDCILPRPIPAKGQVLNQLAAHFLHAVKDICPVWLESNPDPNVSIGKKCKGIPIEIVVRGYLAGHAWRTYHSGARTLCGVPLPSGMKEAEAFPNPIITPTTKAAEGHDQDISFEDLIHSGVIRAQQLEEIYEFAFRLYNRGQQMASDHGLILVDTKYEFGYFENQIVLMDEVHTPDSSRYYLAEFYEERLHKNEPQTQLSKEFVREWLIAHGFQGHEDQMMPHMPDAFVWEITKRYIELFERITGSEFEFLAGPDILQRIQNNLSKYIL